MVGLIPGQHRRGPCWNGELQVPRLSSDTPGNQTFILKHLSVHIFTQQGAS
jgi:hypothetical protein